MECFKDELAALINKYGIDAEANTPDYLLAEIAVDAIASVVGLVKVRDEYKEKPEKPGIPKEVLRVATAIAKATGGTCTVEIVKVPIKPPTEKPKRKNRKKKNHGKETKV